MKAKEVPGMHLALVEISPFFLALYDAFEAASDHGKSYFEQENEVLDLHLHAHLIRFKVQRFLAQHDLKAELDPEDLTNSGIQLTIKRWFIRIRKSSRGAVPGPGRSIKARKYYNQAYQPALSSEFCETFNLLLLWHANSGGDFRGLSLVYPLRGIDKWRYDIPHPADAAHGRSIYQTEFDEKGNLEEITGDLEIEALEENQEDSEAENQ